METTKLIICSLGGILGYIVFMNIISPFGILFLTLIHFGSLLVSVSSGLNLPTLYWPFGPVYMELKPSGKEFGSFQY